MLSMVAVVMSTVVGVQGDGIRVEFDASMHSRVVSTLSGDKPLGDFQPSEILITDAGEQRDFTFESRRTEPITDALGTGTRTTISAHAAGFAKQVAITAYASRPHFLFMQVSYTNTAGTAMHVRGYINHRYQFEAPPKASEPAFWSYQSASFEKRPDWILPVPIGFERGNFLGMNDSDYGGGTPLLDVWTRDVGLAVGHMELVPKQVSLPLKRNADAVEVSLRNDEAQDLAPGQSFATLRSFVAVHTGDYFNTLRAYSQAMQQQAGRWRYPIGLVSNRYDIRP